MKLSTHAMFMRRLVEIKIRDDNRSYSEHLAAAAIALEQKDLVGAAAHLLLAIDKQETK